MKKPQSSFPFKVLLGYLLLLAFGGFTIWFIYNQTVKLSSLNSSKSDHEKLTLIGEVATRLYDTEGISRKIIQNKDTTDLHKFYYSIDTINHTLSDLKSYYPNEVARNELDSIHYLLGLTKDNLKELIDFWEKNASNNYYDRVLKQLEEADYLFGSTDYRSMVKDLEPYQQKVIVEFLEYAEEDNANRLTNRTADELIDTMKQVLLAMELREHNFQKGIAEKENKLISNGIEISNRLRRIRNKIEQDEIQNSLAQVTSQQKMLDQTLKILIYFGIASVCTILTFIILINRDANKSKRYRLEVERAKNYAETLLKSKEQIMAAVTHDLRSPLNSILGYSGLIEKTELSSKQQVYVNQLKKSSDYTIRLVNDLLDFSRLEAGKIAIDQKAFIPKNLIEDTIRINIPTSHSKNIQIYKDLEDSLSETYISDPFRLQQILANLIGNAFKFTEEGYIKIKGEIVYKRNKPFLVIAVKDTGIGISEEHLAFIFDEFSQAESNIEKRYGGSGLGLAITKKLVDLLKGNVQVKSKVGEGSSFIINIPVVLSENNFKAKQKPEKVTALQEKSKTEYTKITDQHILIVDDDPIQIDYLTELLKPQGFQITRAENGEEALEKIKQNRFDLVFTDIQMPKLDGYSLLDKIRKTKEIKAIPIIALSGESNTKKSDYLKKGFTDYLLKPYHPNDLLQIVKNTLRVEIVPIKAKPQPKEGTKMNSGFYDLSEIELFVGEDKSSYYSIVESLVKSLEENLQNLNSNAQNRKKVSSIAHKMLPMMRQIKAHKLIPSLEVLEDTKVELSAAETQENLSTIDKYAVQLIKELKRHLKTEKTL